MHGPALTEPALGSPPPGCEWAEPALQLLVDRARISDVHLRYAFSVDRRDWRTLASCFHPDVEAAGWSVSAPGRSGLVEFIKGVAAFHTTMHMMGNQLIALAEDRAHLDSYAMLTHHYEWKGRPAEYNVSGSRYSEDLERRDGQWAIAHRGGPSVWDAAGLAGWNSENPLVRTLLDRAVIRDLLVGRAVASDRDDTTNHFVAHPWVEVRGDEAWALTYAMVSHRPRGSPSASVGRVRGLAEGEWLEAGPLYRDHLVRRAGQWCLVQSDVDLPDLSTARDLRGPDGADPAARWLADRELIRHTTTAWCRAVDLGDWSAATDLLAPGARMALDPGGPALTDAGALRDALAARHRGVRTCHYPGNQLVDLAGDEALVESYVYVSHQDRDSDAYVGWPGGALRWVDRMVRDDGRWLIADRRTETTRVPTAPPDPATEVP